MITIVLTIHLLLAIALVVTILMQRSEGGALGIGGASQGGMLVSRSQANLLTRTTAVLAAGFIATSLTLAILATHSRKPQSVLDSGAVPTAPGQPATPAAPAAPAPPAPSSAPPAAPAGPGAPLGR